MDPRAFWVFWLNAAGLFFGLVAAILLACLPPQVTRYTRKGEAAFTIYANPTEAGKWWGKYQVWASYLGPALLFLAFLLQLIALWLQ